MLVHISIWSSYLHHRDTLPGLLPQSHRWLQSLAARDFGLFLFFDLSLHQGTCCAPYLMFSTWFTVCTGRFNTHGLASPCSGSQPINFWRGWVVTRLTDENVVDVWDCSSPTGHYPCLSVEKSPWKGEVVCLSLYNSRHGYVSMRVSCD